jgi:peptide/nickel transport system substrate-binding protein
MKKHWLFTGTLIIIVALGIVALSSTSGHTQQSPSPKAGGILKISMAQDITSVGHPMRLRNDETPFVSPWIETLFVMNDEGLLSPHLAKSWDVDPAKKTITLHLQQGVKFHDGTEMDAEAVKFSMTKLRTDAGGKILNLESVDIIDKYTIRCNLSQWQNTFLYTLAWSYGMVISPTAYDKHGKDWVVTNAVGTGPFKLVSAEKNIAYKAVRFDDYWKGKPLLDGIEYHIIVDPMTRMASFMRGEQHVTLNLDPKDVRQLQDSGKFKVATAPGVIYGFLGDGSNPDSPFANINVRRAVGHALDPKTIATSLGYGYWSVCPQNQPTQPGRWADNPNVVGFPYDPAKAKQLLVEAGYPDGFKTTIYSINQPRYIVDFVTAAQSQLAKVGIDAKLELVDSERYFKICIETYWNNGLLPIDMTLRNEIALLKVIYAPEARLVKVMYKADEYRNKLAEVDAAPDFETTKKLMWELNKLENDKYAQCAWQFMIPNISVRWPKAHDKLMTGNAFYWNPAGAWLEE